MFYTYSWRDGDQGSGSVDPDDLMDALSDDLVSDGDLPSALKRLTRAGLRGKDDHQILGTHALLHQVRSQRRTELERYDLDSMVEDLRDRIYDILQTERSEVQARREKAEITEGGATDGDRRALRSLVDHRAEILERFPLEPGSAITALAEYDFLSTFARAKFDALMDVLQRQVIQTQFKSMQQSMQSLTFTDIADLTNALRALNGLVERRESLHPSEFERFREIHGSHFPMSSSLDELLVQVSEQAAQTESLLGSMASEQRRTLEESMLSALRDPLLRNEMARLHALIESLDLESARSAPYPFSGQQSLTFEEALALVRRMHRIDMLERAVRDAHEAADVQSIDPESVREVLGTYAHDSLRALQSIDSALEQAGYLERQDQALVLTARGIRRIGQKALNDVFQHVRRAAVGDHLTAYTGNGSADSTDSKPYEFGDALLVDLSSTLMNAVRRGPPAGRLTLRASDFEVFKTERVSRAATVLMVDLSRSMPMRGCFTAAKKVALALNTLIHSQYPRDHLYVVGFSDFARPLLAESLYRLTMDERVHGTNIQHGLLVARRLLAGHKSGTRQIILITDGEPTAHLENNQVHFSYPPSPATVRATLREVQRCTREGIVINTFMLERSNHLADFVDHMTRINRGRVFYTSPERLGDYVLVDYVGRRRSM